LHFKNQIIFYLKIFAGWEQWLTPVILATREVESRRRFIVSLGK
jgi:hypothetical protein